MGKPLLRGKNLNCLLNCAKVGYPRSRKEVLAIVQAACSRKGLNVTTTHGWCESYCSVRSLASSTDTINVYFDMLEDTLDENKLRNDPSCIFNMVYARLEIRNFF